MGGTFVLAANSGPRVRLPQRTHVPPYPPHPKFTYPFSAVFVGPCTAEILVVSLVAWPKGVRMLRMGVAIP